MCLLGCTQAIKPKNPKDLLKENPNDFLSLNCDSCKAEYFGYLVYMDSLRTENSISKFLQCCNKECSNDVEFSEFSNVLLFKLLQDKADLMLRILEKHKDISMDFILRQLENPLYEDIDLVKTLDQVQKTNGEPSIKNKLINSLNIAIGKG